VVHGGILATMLDEVASRAVFRGDPPRMVVTAKLTVRYRKPVPVETPLLLSGRIVEDKGRVVQVAGEIRDTGGVLYAEADVTLMEVDPLAVGTTTVTAENWKVYPPSQD
jgi:acyl-coenzyme A thioesterase PaaI-like protein